MPRINRPQPVRPFTAYRLRFGDYDTSPDYSVDDVRPVWYLDGVTWAEVIDYGDDLHPYYEGDRDDVDGAKAWAGDLIDRTSDFRVAGWDGATPTLVLDEAVIKITMVDGDFVTTRLPHYEADQLLATLASGRQLVTVPGGRSDGYISDTVHTGPAPVKYPPRPAERVAAETMVGVGQIIRVDVRPALRNITTDLRSAEG